MSYIRPFILRENIGNNALSWEGRKDHYKKNPALSLASLKNGTLKDVKIGEKTVFEEIDDGILKSCIGLEHFIRLSDSKIPTTIFDNHNHALYFWLEAIRERILDPGFELIHIDEHSDLWSNENILDRKKAIENEGYAWHFTNFSCNVGNYIDPVLKNGIIGKMVRIENEYQVDTYMDYFPSKNSVLNIDLDFFAPEMDFINTEKKVRIIKSLIPKVACITIATSPFFIDQKRAIGALHKLFS